MFDDKPRRELLEELAQNVNMAMFFGILKRSIHDLIAMVQRTYTCLSSYMSFVAYVFVSCCYYNNIIIYFRHCRSGGLFILRE